MPDMETLDRSQQSISIRCARCRWAFRCPIEQLRRTTCRACESIAEAIIREADLAIQPPA